MNCRICNGPTLPAYVLNSKRYSHTVSTYRCDACAAFFSEGSPTSYEDVDLCAFYEQFAEPIRKRYATLFQFIRANFQGRSSFLDIGAGMGFSLDVARSNGMSCKGLEPNRYLASAARSRDLDVSDGYLDETFEGRFDIVLIDNVLEHVTDPLGFLKLAKAHLSDGGLMVVAVPPLDWLRRVLAASSFVRNQVGAPQANVFCEVDEHLSVFSRKSMDKLAARSGLRLLGMRFHHSPVYDNALARMLGIDDGYYFAVNAS